jgi:hypothetical protein
MARSLTTKTDSPTSLTVSSATGFNAGDLVYYRNGDFGRVADNAVSTAPFANTTPDPTFLVAGFSGLETVTQLNGGSINLNSALLTNGNIVQVFCANNAFTGLLNGRYYFQIITTSGTVVVAPTILSATFYTNTNGNGTVGVISLTGGGFVAYWQGTTGGTANSLVYGVWTNAGAATTAPIQDTTKIFGPTISPPIRAVALPNGGFVIAGIDNSTSEIQHRIYNSVGTALYSWTVSTAPTSTTATNSYGLGIAARSNSEFMIAYNANNTNYYPNYYITDATNVAVSSAEVTTGLSASRTTYACEAAVLSDGTTFVLVINIEGGGNVYNQITYRKIPTGNVLGNEIELPNASLNWNLNDNPRWNLNAKGLSGNKLMVAWSNAPLNINYAVTSSDDRILTGDFPRAFNGTYLNVTYRTQFALLEITGYILLFYSGFADGNGGFTTISNLKIDSTTLDMVATSASVPQTTVVGNGDVSGYVLSGSTPSVARFTSSASGSITEVQEDLAFSPIVVQNPYSANQEAVYSTSAALPNGGFVIVTKSDVEPYPIVANIYSPQYSLIKSVLVTNGSANLTQGPTVAVATMTSGKFAVIYSLQDQTQLFGTIFSASGGTLNNFVTPNTYYATTTPVNFAACGIKNDRIALVGLSSSNNIQYLVYDNSGNVLAGPTTVVSLANARSFNIAPTPLGFIVGYATSANGFYRSYYEYATNTFTNTQTYTAGVGGYNPENTRMQMAPQATGCTLAWPTTDANTQNSRFLYYNISSTGTVTSGAPTMGDCNSGYRWSMCSTSGGGVAVAFVSGSATLRVNYWTPYRIYSGTGSFAHESGYQIDIPTVVQTGYQASMTISPLANDWVLVTWINGDNIPLYSVVKPKNTMKSVALISGTTQSNGQGIAPGTTGNGVTGYVFQGVATTTATAGGTGEVQTVGTALLNSNYSASVSAQAFDHNTPNGSGIAGNKGTIVGRTVNLLGVS